MNEKGKNYDVDHRVSVEVQILGTVIGMSQISTPDVLVVRDMLYRHNLEAYDFYAPIHKQIFTAILECYEKGLDPNIVSLGQFRPPEFRDNNSKYWEYPLVRILQKSLLSAAHLERDLMLLKQYILMDFWNQQADNILYGNWNDKDILDVSDTLVKAYDKLFKRLTEGVADKDVDDDYEEEITNKVKRHQAGKPVGITTSVQVIDDFTGGYSLGELVIIAARPGMGKTTYALISAWNTSEKGTKTAFFSLEMAANQLISKLVSLITGIEYKRIKKGALTNDELQEVIAAKRYIKASNLIIDDKAKTIEDVIEKSAEYAKEGVRLIFMDYIQRCGSRTKMEMRALITFITRELKTIAKSHYVAFVALSQLSRAVERRDNKRPILGDLKESSSIEEDADIVAFLFRQAYYDAQSGEAPGYSEMFKTEFIIGKGRDIGTETIHLFMDPIKMFIAPYNFNGVYN